MSFFGQTQSYGTSGSGAMGMAQSAFTDQNDVEVQLPPGMTESISCVKYAPAINNSQVYQQIGSQLLAVAFWDGNLIIYQTQVIPTSDQVQTQVMLQNHNQSPILGLCWCPDQIALLIASADNNIKKWDLQSNQISIVGQHAQPVKDIYCFIAQGQSFIVSGGWDSRVKFWQWNGPQLNQIGEAYLGKPVHYMSGEFPLLVTAHSELFIHYWNLNTIFQGNFNPLGVTNSPLKYPTTCIAAFPDGKGYAIASIEGRCGIKYIDLQKNQVNLTDDFCFKCHRVDDTQTINTKPSQVYTVNGISFNKQYGSFATYGQDGSFYIWNKDTKSKLKNNKPAPWPTTSADFLENGQQFAIAYGYDWGKGAEELKKNQYPVKLYIRKIKEEEVMKKK